MGHKEIRNGDSLQGAYEDLVNNLIDFDLFFTDHQDGLHRD